MTNDSLKLAKLWLRLNSIKEEIDNELLPLTGYLEVKDEGLTEAMENLSAKVGNHFGKFKLSAGETKPKNN